MRVLATCAVVFTIAGCGTTVRVESTGVSYPANPVNCEIALFRKDVPPTEPYETLGKIEAHVARNVFLGGMPLVEAETHRELREQACQLGANAVVIDESVESSVIEMRHIHVWARALRIPDRGTPPPDAKAPESKE